MLGLIAWHTAHLKMLCCNVVLGHIALLYFLVIWVQGGITCGAIDEPRKTSKAIDERVIINFRDKKVVIARFRDKNGGFILLNIYMFYR